MTAILLPRRHVEQPQGYLEIDWAHPLARGLSFIHHAGLGPVFLLRESTEYSPVAQTGTYSVGYDRYQHGAYAGSNYLQLSNMPSLLPTFTAAKRAMTASLFAVARQGGSNESTIISVSSANNNPLYRIVLLAGRTAMFQVRPSGTTSTNGNAVGTSTWAAGTYRVAVGVCRGIVGSGTSQIYVDGRIEGTGDVSLADTYDQTWITEGVLLRTSAALYMDGAIALSGGYSRPLDDAEIQALSDNPWQLFKARPQRIYFDLGTGGDTLTIAGLSIALFLDSPALTQAGTLSVNDADIATTLDSPTLSAAIDLTVADLLASVALDSPVLTQANTLSVQSTDVAVSLDTPALTQAHALAVADTGIGVTLDSPTLTAAGSLSIADLLLAVAIEQPLLAQAHQLSVADLAMGVTLDGITLSTGLTLTIDGLDIALSLDNVSLTQAGVLIVQGLDIPLSIDAVTLTQAHALTVADLLSAVSLDSLELSAAGNVLAVQDAQIAVTLDSPTLTQSHILAVNDAVVAVTLGGITIVIPGAEVERYPRITLSRINRVTLDRINQITLSR